MDVAHPRFSRLDLLRSPVQADFREAALLDDSEMLAAVTALNQQISELALVLNSPPFVTSPSCDRRIRTCRLPCGQTARSTYLFAVGMRTLTTATFTLARIKGEKMIEVLGENQRLPPRTAHLAIASAHGTLHLYRL